MSNFNHLDELLKGFVKRGLPGCGMAVAKEGKILYEGFHGLMDIEKKLPFTDESVCRIYSLSKVVTCTAGLMLMERGKFLLNDPLYEYIPELKDHIIAKENADGTFSYKESKGPMLVKHAFMMSVGLPYPNNPTYAGKPTIRKIQEIQDRDFDNRAKLTMREYVKSLSTVPIAHEPGEKFTYGFGHDIVGALIEIVSGKTLGQFLKEEIFEPLGMDSTGFRFFGNLRERLVTLYDVENPEKIVKTSRPNDVYLEPDALYETGGSGLLSTVKDYLKFTQMMANGGKHNNQQIIGHRTIGLMRKNHMSEQTLKDFQNFYLKGYGYGLGVRTMLDTASAGSNNHVGAFGWTGVLGCWMEMYPEEGFSAVYMHQTVPNNEAYHHLRVRSAVYGAI